MRDIVVCPYCGFNNDITDASFVVCPDDNKFDLECESCGKEFEVEIEFHFYPSYHSSKIEYVNCSVCGKNTRDIFRYDSKKVCKACLGVEMNEEDW